MIASTTTKPTTPKTPRPVKVLCIEQVAKRLSCSEDQVWDLILSFDLETVHSITWEGPAEVTEAEVRRYLRDGERRRLEQERRAKLELEGWTPPPPVFKPAPPDPLLSIAEISKRMCWSPQYVRELIYKHRLSTFQPLFCRSAPLVHESELQRYLEARRLRAKCKENRKWRRLATGPAEPETPPFPLPPPVENELDLTHWHLTPPGI